MKQLDDSLWQGIQEEFPVGKILTGKITNISDYGAFIELKNGIEGLVYSTEISWLKSNQNPKKSLTIGQEVQFKILEIDIKKHRISLSIKQCEENPLVLFAQQHPVGSIIKAPVRNVTDFGIFVGVAEQFDGMIHESDISWEGNGPQLLKSFKRGTEVDCKVLAIDVEKERISLGIKQLTEKPESKNNIAADLKKNMSVTCIVTAVKDDGIEVNIDDKAVGFIKKADLSSEKSGQKPELFAPGDRVDAKITNIDQKESKVTLSIKALEIEEREKAIKEYGSTDSGARLGDILGAALGEDKDKD
jgi:small subunit ribosomal protein S1